LASLIYFNMFANCYLIILLVTPRSALTIAAISSLTDVGMASPSAGAPSATIRAAAASSLLASSIEARVTGGAASSFSFYSASASSVAFYAAAPGSSKGLSAQIRCTLSSGSSGLLQIQGNPKAKAST